MQLQLLVNMLGNHQQQFVTETTATFTSLILENLRKGDNFTFDTYLKYSLNLNVQNIQHQFILLQRSSF